MAEWTGAARGAGAARAPALLPAYAGLVLCVAMWGTVFVAVAELLPHADAVQIVTIRFALVGAAALVVLLALPAQRPALDRGGWVRIAACGILAVPGAQYVLVEAQNYLSPSIAALIVTFAPAIAAVLAAVFLGVRLGVRELAGFALALAGVALVLVVGAGTGVSLEHSSPAGAAIAVLSPLSWAGYTLAVAPLVARHPPVGVMCWVFLAGGVALLPAVPHAAAGLGDLDGGDWAWLVVLALPATAVPNLLWVVSLRRLPVHRTSAFLYLVPIFATAWSAALLGRTPEAVVVPGGLMVLVGVYLTQGRRGRRVEDEVGALG
jgi:drug/metabolite transporter (DMT)-like permease